MTPTQQTAAGKLLHLIRTLTPYLVYRTVGLSINENLGLGSLVRVKVDGSYYIAN